MILWVFFLILGILIMWMFFYEVEVVIVRVR